MNFAEKCLPLGFGSLVMGCAAPLTATEAADTLPAAAMQPYSRAVLNAHQQLKLINLAVHFGFSFEGIQCQLYAALPAGQDHNYLQHELGGVC